MRPGESVQVVKGEHEGKQAKVKGSDGNFYNLQLLTPSGNKQVNGLVSLHRTHVMAIEGKAHVRT